MASFHYKILSDDPNISIFAVNKHVIENLEFITKNSGIVFKEQINMGKFGFIFNADSPQSNDVAVKIISENDIGEYELAWKSFHNKFVTPLLETHLYREINTRLFVMQRAECTLDMCIRNEDFTKRTDSLDIVSSWIDNVVSGIQYIHAKGYGHCSVKRKNVLIMDDNRAVLCHFHGLAPVNSFVNCGEIDVMFRPPECFRNGIDRRPLAGRLDIYSIGVLVIEAIAGDYLGLKLPSRVTCWSTDIYPILFKTTSNLTKMSKGKYPNADKKNLNTARNFIHACLRIDPEKRVKITQLWKHEFVGGVELFPEDNIWLYKANKYKLRKIVKNLQINIEENQPTIGYKIMSCEVKEKSNKEKLQKYVNSEESHDKDTVSNVNFSPVLNNTIAGKSLYKDERICMKQDCSRMQRDHGECFDIESESSLIPEPIKNELGAYAHYKDRDAGKMNYNINYQTDEVNEYKEKEKVQSEVEEFMLSENTDLKDIKKNEKVPWNRNHYVERVDQELSKTNLLLKEEECENTNSENVSDSCKNITLRQLMNHAFSDSLVYRISHPENFLNKLSTRLTHNERKKDVIRNFEKDVFRERVVDKDCSKIEAETGIFSDSLKRLPLKMLDILLTHLL